MIKRRQKMGTQTSNISHTYVKVRKGCPGILTTTRAHFVLLNNELLIHSKKTM